MFFVSQKKYDELEERFIAEQNENTELREQLKKEKLRSIEFECQVADYRAKEKQRSENARRAANIRHHGKEE